ncbi:transglutaminaseTgpA domain-containing protein [Neorhodopirellula pilleata]|uniref:Protein-glutamine gamma-glutamyltransferase n=1 Tax=Neorhodopirellula pilleata TaxID=2714738 RepID=A0A5C6A3B4_9BACT|nr:transglutaminaseTgpA domain-containing protein [Neorhodopirellula pilleata]TWT93681.1 Protein-glutamine gamma-glutamyltransferase [Neorhodopirellula pilleata]
MKPDFATFKRLTPILPVLVALLIHAIALDRWSLAVPAAIAVLYAMSRDTAVQTGSWHWYLSVIGGLVIGLIVPSAEITHGPIPPVAVGTITGMAVALIVMAVFAGKTTVAWAASWGLIAVSGKLQMTGPLYYALIAFFATTLVTAATHSRLTRAGGRLVFPFLLFIGLVVLSTMAMSVGLKHVDRLFLSSMQSVMQNTNTPSTTGLSKNITLSSRSTIRESKRELFEVSQMPGLLRVQVMDQFDGLRWTTSDQLDQPLGSFGEPTSDRDDTRQLDFWFLEDLSGALPSPAGTRQVDGATPRITGGWILRGEPVGLSMSLIASKVARLPNETRPSQTPVHTSEPQSTASRIEPNLFGVDESVETSLSRVAGSLTDGAMTNEAKADAVQAFFHNEFQYSLTTDLTGDAPPLVVFVEQRRPAYCVYFASAMALMLRTQGVPTRVVSGFAPTESNPLTGRVTVRERDSHAWVEVWSEAEQRYLTYDPTPAASRRQVIGVSEPVSWSTAIIAAIRSQWRRIWQTIQNHPSTWLVWMLTSPVVWLAIAMVAIWIAWRRRGRPVPADSNADPIDPVLRSVYQHYLDSLERLGVMPQPWETDDELLTRVAMTVDASTAGEATDFIGLYRAARYGGAKVDDHLSELARSIGGTRILTSRRA